MRDLFNNVEFRPAEVPISAAQTDTTNIVTAIIDMQGFESLVFVVLLGTMAASTIASTFLMEEGDDSGLSDNTAVADKDLLPFSSSSTPEVVAAFDQADDGLVRRIGYRGNKRYVRLTIDPASNDSALPIAIVAALSHSTTLPVTTQVA